MSGIDSARDEKWSEWFTWHGAERCPIDSDCTVEFVTKGMGGGETSNPKGLLWVQAGTEADIIAYRYKIKEPESDMHPDLKWLARNTRPKQFGQISVRRNADFHSGYQWSDLRQTGEGWYHHSKVEAARQQLGLDQLEVTEAEDEAWQAKERSLYDEIKEGFDSMADNVNHPTHYQSDNGIECIDAIRAALGLDGFVAHCRGTAIKYAFRAGKKKAHAEDLRKAAWYLTRAAEALEG